MFGKLLEVYKIYFLISLIVTILLLLGNYNEGWLTIVLIVFGAFFTPFLYELDYLIYVYIVEPESEVSKNISMLLKQKNFIGAFLYAHENSTDFNNTIFRSILMVISIFALAFLIVFSPINFFAKSVVMTFLLTTLYLETTSFLDGTWKAWYSFFDWTPKEIAAKAFVGFQYLLYVIFIFQIL